MINLEEVPDYRGQSLRYLANGLGFLARGETAKAGEFFWGSMAQALKAVAASRGLGLRTHRYVRDFAVGLARELRDEDLLNAFEAAESLHGNFYESDLGKEDVALKLERIRPAIDKLLRLIPRPLGER